MAGSCGLFIEGFCYEITTNVFGTLCPKNLRCQLVSILYHNANSIPSVPWFVDCSNLEKEKGRRCGVACHLLKRWSYTKLTNLVEDLKSLFHGHYGCPPIFLPNPTSINHGLQFETWWVNQIAVSKIIHKKTVHEDNYCLHLLDMCFLWRLVWWGKTKQTTSIEAPT
jgi:hypothetical protein